METEIYNWRLPRKVSMTASCSWCQHLRVMLKDVGRGFFIITHSSLAMVGVGASVLALTLVIRPGLWDTVQQQGLHWLRNQQVLVSWWPENTAERAVAVELKDLPKEQAAVAQWLANKYRVAPEPLAALVAEAHVLSKSTRLSPNLILAVAAIESNFHPYVQSSVGAQGLMQVMTKIHEEKYRPYGGRMAAFDPVINMRVGVSVLQEVIRIKGGSLEEGLKFYLGGYDLTEDGGYVAKVMAEKERLDQVAAGKVVPFQ